LYQNPLGSLERSFNVDKKFKLKKEQIHIMDEKEK